MPNQITWYAHKLNKTVESFKYVFDKALENLIIDRMEQNEDIFVRFMNDKEFQKVVSSNLLQQVYEQINAEKSISGQK